MRYFRDAAYFSYPLLTTLSIVLNHVAVQIARTQAGMPGIVNIATVLFGVIALCSVVLGIVLLIGSARIRDLARPLIPF